MDAPRNKKSKIGCVSAKISNKFESFALNFHYLCTVTLVVENHVCLKHTVMLTIKTNILKTTVLVFLCCGVGSANAAETDNNYNAGASGNRAETGVVAVADETGDEAVIDKTIAVGSFTGVEAGGAVRVHFTQNSADGKDFKVVAKGRKCDIEKYLLCEVREGVLKIKLNNVYQKATEEKVVNSNGNVVTNGNDITFSSDGQTVKIDHIDVYVTAPELKSLSVSASASFEASELSSSTEMTVSAAAAASVNCRSITAGGALTVNVSSSSHASVGTIKAGGNADITLSSMGSLTTEALQCANLNVRASSRASANIKGIDCANANVMASSAARVMAFGQAGNVVKRMTSAGRIGGNLSQK